MPEASNLTHVGERVEPETRVGLVQAGLVVASDASGRKAGHARMTRGLVSGSAWVCIWKKGVGRREERRQRRKQERP